MSTEKEWGVIAEYKNPGDLYHAAEKLRDKGFKKFECYTPFPVHGLDDAMGLPATKLPWIILLMGITGLTIGFGMQIWVTTEGYRMIISGKPDGFKEIINFVPIGFEVTILLSSFGAIFGMFALNQLPTFYHPVFTHKPFLRVTDDAFFITIEAADPLYNKEGNKKLLAEIGGHDVSEIHG